ncbi:MAG: DUF3634 family protein [Tepidisphaeraceae bacterium]
MVDLLYRLFGLLAIGFCAWMAFKPSYAFVVRMRRGQLKVRGAVLAPRLLEEIRSALASEAVDRGWFAGQREGRRTRLIFCKQWNPGVCQRIRNIWASATS